MDFKRTIHILIILYTELSIGALAKRNKIIGGDNADIIDYPYMASLKNSLSDYHFCGGAIITNLHILTAAHCLWDKQDHYHDIIVYTGSTMPSVISGQAHHIASVNIHPAFEGNIYSSHDIAVVTIKNAMKFNKRQRKINLPTKNICNGDPAVLTGWGSREYPSLDYSEILQRVSMKVIEEFECQQYFQEPLRKQHFCAFRRFGSGSCHGDSGGPLVVKGRVVGILTGNVPCAIGFPDVYINVFDYLGFISYIIEN